MNVDFQTYFKELTPQVREEIESLCEKKWAPSGTVILNQHDESDAVFIIEDGIVEVIVETPDSKSPPPLAYLGRGDLIGELGVLNSKVRSATIKAAADVVYKRIEKDDFLKLIKTQPAIGLYISYLLAERLAATTSNLAYNSFCVDFSGKLPSVDLRAVMQTIASSSVTGELILIDASKEETGSFFIDEGVLKGANYMHLIGEEAMWQLFFEENIEGAFRFTRAEGPRSGPLVEAEVNLPLSDVLMQAAIKHDEYNTLNEDFRQLRGCIERNSDELQSVDARWDHEIRLIWQMIDRGPVDLRSIWSRCNMSTITLAFVLRELQNNGTVLYDPNGVSPQ